MSGFKKMVEADIKKVFINQDEFADLYTIIYDGETYENIPVVLSGIKEKDRQQLVWDHAQGLYLVTTVMHLAASDLNGVIPEKGARLKIIDGNFFREYYVASSLHNMGMLRVELEGIDE